MMDVVFTINGVSFASKLSTYRVEHEREFPTLVTALDGTEYAYGRRRPTIYFSLRPLSDAELETLYDALSEQNTVSYTDPHRGGLTVTASMRFTSNSAAQFGLRSIDGNRYYKGGEMTLRQRTVI